MVSAAEIRWTLEPVQAPDWLLMSDDDLLVAALSESDTYRQLAQVAIHQLHRLKTAHDRLGEQHHRLLSEYRSMRVRALEAAA